jgi:hypothetical protein
MLLFISANTVMSFVNFIHPDGNSLVGIYQVHTSFWCLMTYLYMKDSEKLPFNN